MSHPETSKHLRAFSMFVAQSGVNLIPMIDHMPKPDTRSIIDSWFNVPTDQHNSDLGLKIYGKAVAQVLIDKATKNVLFTNDSR